MLSTFELMCCRRMDLDVVVDLEKLKGGSGFDYELECSFNMRAKIWGTMPPFDITSSPDVNGF